MRVWRVVAGLLLSMSLLETPGYSRASVLLPLVARTASGTLDVPGDLVELASAVFLLDVTNADTEAGDTLNVYIQHSPDGISYDDFVSFTQIIGTGAAANRRATWSALASPETEHAATGDATLAAGSVVQGPVAGKWRIKWVIVDVATAGNQSFTFSVSMDSQRRR